jgi:hypothetical protein
LELANFTFCASDNAECADPYTTFNSLNSLTICYFTKRDAPILSISNATLVNLTICSSDFNKIKLSTPSLYTFTFCGPVNHKLCGSSLSSVKQVDIDVKSLTVTQTTLKVPCHVLRFHVYFVHKILFFNFQILSKIKCLASNYS